MFLYEMEVMVMNETGISADHRDLDMLIKWGIDLFKWSGLQTALSLNHIRMM